MSYGLYFIITFEILNIYSGPVTLALLIRLYCGDKTDALTIYD